MQSHANRLQLEAIVSLMLYGGLRHGEVYRLEPEEMHPESDAVIARSRKNREGVWVTRSVPLFEPMRDALAAWVEFRSWIDTDHERPWLTLWHQYHAQPASLYMWERWLPRIGRGWTAHRFRHTCATTDYMAPYPGRRHNRIDYVRPTQARPFRWIMPKIERVWGHWRPSRSRHTGARPRPIPRRAPS